ncbi:hypothetical protein HPP92_026545 [Vanilla planifolia]|uniref:Uncharacterized protein n=1 Tax=Vanilla planifolia TaxID=51239 RepID=A0A835PIB2_VANPL|nr:hypothetical protein HPP92_026773 [Vanilla planifolia]KAG0450822.1 hypothetical protein HPP92_026545 [Vanilla planifolia]
MMPPPSKQRTDVPMWAMHSASVEKEMAIMLEDREDSRPFLLPTHPNHNGGGWGRNGNGKKTAGDEFGKQVKAQ